MTTLSFIPLQHAFVAPRAERKNGTFIYHDPVRRGNVRVTSPEVTPDMGLMAAMIDRLESNEEDILRNFPLDAQYFSNDSELHGAYKSQKGTWWLMNNRSAWLLKCEADITTKLKEICSQAVIFGFPHTCDIRVGRLVFRTGEMSVVDYDNSLYVGNCVGDATYYTVAKSRADFISVSRVQDEEGDEYRLILNCMRDTGTVQSYVARFTNQERLEYAVAELRRTACMIQFK